MAACNSISNICTKTLHTLLSFAHCRAASTVIPLLPKPTFTRSTQPNLCLPRTRRPLTSPPTPFWPYGTHPFFHMPKPSPYSLICSTRQLSFYSSSPPNLFIPNSINSRHSNQTSQTLYFKNIHFPSLSTSHTPCLCSLQRRWYNYSFIYIHTSWPISPIYCSAHFSALPTLSPHSLCIPHPFHILHLLPLATTGT